MCAQYSEQTSRPTIDGTKGTISCSICGAIYEPSSLHGYLLQGPPIALESAFMCMCHFCFRCRRPACPDCWDHVHGICGACVQEARLPFRTQAAPLSGVLFAPSRQEQQRREQSESAPLILMQPGLFQKTFPPAIDEVATIPEIPSARQAFTGRTAKQRITKPEPPITASSYQHPSNMTAQKTVSTPTERQRIYIDELETRPPKDNRSRRQLGYALRITLFALLIIVLFFISAACISTDMNALIDATLHIDIRGEIAYLWALITHLY
ncbi:MAG: hypothetical protein E6J34_23030 [Chloroflexi bacterium]|nr:MAG: hypothetical protein E6J34_23030 [Chloroflexota bacterium]